MINSPYDNQASGINITRHVTLSVDALELFREMIDEIHLLEDILDIEEEFGESRGNK